MQHRDKIVLEKIVAVIDEAMEILAEVSEEKFLEKPLFKLATAMSVIRVGELVKNLSEEIRLKNPQVPWRDVAGFRDIAAHKYDVLDFKRVYVSIKKEFPELKSQIEKILEVEKVI